jgi:hypothetical protein
MTNAPVPPQQPEKKGLSPLAWIGIGCLGLLVIGGIVATVIAVFVVGKVKEAAEDPVAATAKLLAAANPDIELVSADKESRTVVFRDLKTGEELTFNYDDIENGKVSFSSGSGTAELEVESGDEGGLTVKTSEGTATFGAGEASDIPAWVPVFSGATPEGSFSAEGGGQSTGTFSFTANASVEQILGFYDDEAEELGLEVQSRTTTAEGAMWIAGTSDESRGLTVMTSKGDGGTEVVVTFTEKR